MDWPFSSRRCVGANAILYAGPDQPNQTVRRNDFRLIFYSDPVIDRCNDTRYIIKMIRTFKNRALKKLYEKGDPSKINADHIERVEDILFRLDNAVKPSDMDWPGWKLHPLKGKHKGFWAVWVSGNYRIWYRFEDGDTFDVDYGDYH